MYHYGYRLSWVLCLLLLHTPNGVQIWIRSEGIEAVKPIGTKLSHVAEHTHALMIYDGGRAQGVSETPEALAAMIKKCEGNKP